MSRLRVRLWFYGCVLAGLVISVAFSTWMPGDSYSGPRPNPTVAQKELQRRLRLHVEELATKIGARNAEHAARLNAARDYIQAALAPFAANAAALRLEDVGPQGAGAENILFEVRGPPQSPIIVVGAHYDSVHTSPGANDNASGVAIGFYSDRDSSQKYPWPVGLLYPSRGNFLAFVGDLGSRALVRTAIATFRKNVLFPSEGAALPATFPGVDWSDHWSFRQAGYPAIMITDTAIYRDPNYHLTTDTADKLDYDALARVTAGIEAVVRELASSPD